VKGEDFMKRILFIITNLGGGGAEKVLINILNNLDYDKYKVDLLLISRQGLYLDKVNKNVNIKYVLPNQEDKGILQDLYRRFRYRIYTEYPQLMAKMLIGKKYDVEIAFLEGAPTKFLTYSHNRSSKKVAWVHIDLTKHRTMSYEMEREIYKNIDDVICVSQQSRDKFIDMYPEYRNKAKVIYNLIDKENIKTFAEEEIQFNFNENSIVAIGRLTGQKRFDILIRAHKLLLNEGINNNLVILGEGELRSELETLVKELGVEESVLMPGFIKNPYPYIKNSDLFVVSSDYEGFSLVVAEAMTLGKAIVSTDCTGPSELLGYGEFGVIVDKGNQHTMKDWLKDLLTNKDLRVSYEHKAIERSEILNKETVMNNIYNLFNVR
jgi:glycosyltransferase involved in cell wall biosynthesis